MAAVATFYEVQADACIASAALANLPMLRAKFESAAAAWQALALRERQIESARVAGTLERLVIAS